MYFYRLMNKLFLSEALLNFVVNSFKKTKNIKGNNLAYLIGFEWDFSGCVLRLFYMVEQNTYLSGYHAHFLLWSDSENKSELKQFEENSLRGKSEIQTVNTYLEPFDTKEGSVAYILKQINLNPDGFDLIWKK